MDHYQNTRSIFSSHVELNLPRENPLQFHSLSTKRRHHGSAWIMWVCECECVCEKHDRYLPCIYSIQSRPSIVFSTPPSEQERCDWPRRAWRLSRTTRARSPGSRSAGCSNGVKVDLNYVSLAMIGGELLHKLCISICTSPAWLISMRWVKNMALWGYFHRGRSFCFAVYIF